MKHIKNFLVAFAIMCIVPGLAWGTAETLTAVRGNSNFPVYGSGMAGTVKVAYGSYEVAANVEAGDIFEMCRIPAGATIVGGMVYADDMDTGAEALEIDLGWAANGGSGTYDSVDADGLGDFGVWTGDIIATSVNGISPVTGNILPVSGPHLVAGDLPTFTHETLIQFTGVAAATTFAAGNMSVVIYYTMD